MRLMTVAVTSYIVEPMCCIRSVHWDFCCWSELSNKMPRGLQLLWISAPMRCSWACWGIWSQLSRRSVAVHSLHHPL